MLFEVGFYYFLHKWSSYWDNVSRATFKLLFEGQGHSMTFQHNSFRPITLWFEVEFYNYFTGMISILRQFVECNILVAPFKAKVTGWPCSKSCLAQNFVIWSRILQLLLTNYFPVSNTFSGSITRSRPALVFKCYYLINCHIKNYKYVYI